MISRVVLGCGSLANAVVDPLSERSGRLTVLADDENAVRTFREEGVAAERADVTDEATLGEYSPDTVVVATDEPRRNEAAARAASQAIPGAFLLAYAGQDPSDDVLTALEALADTVVDPTAATTERVVGATGDETLRARKLLSVLRDIDGTLAVVTHHNPDPDAIASAVALERIADRVGTAADICYFGDISHQENRAFVNLLGFELHNLEADPDLTDYAGVALVDHSRPGVNDGLPEDTAVDVVVDHHPPSLPVDARFVDLRSEVGATSTLMVDYLRWLSMTPGEATATGLLFGIRIDTNEFTREVSPHDFRAAAFLLPRANLGTLERVDSPSISASTIETIGRAIRNRKRHGPVLVTGVGALSDRDALAQAADRLLDMEGVETSFVHGIADGTAHVSARSRGNGVNLGETLRDAFGRIGSAGGHAEMAGAQLSLGMLADVEDDDESLAAVVDDIVTERFLEAYDSRTRRVIRDVYPDALFGPGGLDPDACAPGSIASDVPDESEGDEGTDDADGKSGEAG